MATRPNLNPPPAAFSPGESYTNALAILAGRHGERLRSALLNRLTVNYPNLTTYHALAWDHRHALDGASSALDWIKLRDFSR
jgi:hypothetical protein